MWSSLFSLALMAILFDQLVAGAQNKECPNRCGDVAINYPLGIGPNCSRNEYFNVTCDASSPSNPKPILTKFNIELLELGRHSWANWGQLTVRVPVVKACGTDGNSVTKGAEHEVISWSSLNLRGSPFSISDSNNLFGSIGCDGFATLHSDSGGAPLGGCTSTCNPANSGSATDLCNGYRCCRSEIHMKYDKLQTLSFKIDVSRVGSCRSAFIISREYLTKNLTTLSAINRSVAIPVVLQWSSYQSYTAGEPIEMIAIYIGSACVTIACTCGCFCSCWFYKTRKKRKEIKLRVKYFRGRLMESSSDREMVYRTKLFTIKELKRATDNFSSDRIIGQGGQGTVYKGMLINGQVIAVKRSKIFEERQWKQFINEVILLGQVNHRNIVKLLGCCIETKLPLLIYEFIPNGTLSQHIHNETSKLFITRDMRVSIASETAGAIAYLHSSSSTPLYHRDIKSTNILLDDKLQAKVSDFGIAKAIPLEQTHLTTCVQGTFGYLDPEYFQSSQFSEKSDVYSFGVVLVELLTGQHPIRKTITEEERSLAEYFISAMNESALDKILDPLVLDENSKEEVMLVANVAKQCLNSRGVDRPTMAEVAIKLEGLRKKSSSRTFGTRQISLEIEDVVTMIDNAYTTSALHNFVNTSHGNCVEEQPLFNTTW